MSALEPDELDDKDFEGRPSGYTFFLSFLLALMGNWFMGLINLVVGLALVLEWRQTRSGQLPPIQWRGGCSGR
uniref:Uncharacterized protein n=1 Tax=Aegilops tauschii subsp. strangulata TaxID=200361 RepID=A0A453GDV2_AEGTS